LGGRKGRQQQKETAIKTRNNAFQNPTKTKKTKKVRKPQFPDTVLSYISPFLHTCNPEVVVLFDFLGLGDSMLLPVVDVIHSHVCREHVLKQVEEGDEQLKMQTIKQE
jgi:hypothetical protein